MENNTKRKIMIVITLVAVLLVSIVGTYAYFTSGINNDQAQSAVLKTGSMALTFEDNDAGINEKLMFGESVVKKFKIINTGTLEASLSLDFDQMINTYLNGSLSYNLSYSSEEDGEYEEIIPETNMPVSSEPLTQTLAQELSVPAGDTYYYNLTITLNVTDFDQTDDRDAVYNTRFSVGDPVKYRYYSLTVDSNGGSWGEYTSPQEYLLKNKETLTISNIPTRVGHTFLGWKLTGVSSSFDDDTFTMGISDAKLVAQWNINKHTVTINKDEGITTIETEYGKTIDLGEPPYKEGYTFTGWESTGGVIEGNTLSITEDKDITVTPTYVINRYKYIVYHNKQNINDEEYTLVGADTDEGEADYNSTVLPKIKTYTGFISPSVKSLTIGHETVYPPVLNKVDYNYDRNRYTLTVNSNGGTYSGSTSQELKYEQSITLANPTKTGYNFTNWTTTSGRVDGSIFTMETSDATVTANYTPKQFTVTFNANGGSTPTSSKTVTYNSTYGTLPTPTYTGYKFLGWFTAASGGTQVTSSTTWTRTSNQTLYAQWKRMIGTAATLGTLKITPKSGTPTFANAATTDEGVYSMADDYGTSYYFRGAVTNNYVKFGGFYWRIVRINGDGSIRMIYDGTQAYTNAGGGYGSGGTDRYTHTSKQWNANYNDAKYVGWMYGPSGTTSSTSKSQAQTNTVEVDLKKNVVDPWYKANIEDKGLSKYVSDEIFCNDRSTPGSSATGWSLDTGKGFGSNATGHGGISRLGGPWRTTATEPTFVCPQKNDAFTVSDTTKGNGSLVYPVGLITADEIVAAGSGKYNTTNKYYYLYKNSSYFYWSFSPYDYDGGAYVFIVNTYGTLNSTYAYSTNGAVAPVINIAPKYAATMTGEGSMTKPYQIPGVN